MTRLTRDDLSVIEGEARVSDRRLVQSLDLSSVDTLRRIYKRHEEEILGYGPILTQSEEKSSAKVSSQSDGKVRGRPKLTYLFTEEQALLICMFSRTEKAAEARRNLIEVFQAVRRGDLYTLEAMRQRGADPLRATPDRNKFEVAADHAETVLRQLRALSEGDEFLRDITHLDIWPSKRRPRWWHDIEVREFLTMSHRQMSTVECARVGRIHYGARCPGKSAIGEFWLKLDEARTGRKHVPKTRQRRAALPASQA